MPLPDLQAGGVTQQSTSPTFNLIGGDSVLVTKAIKAAAGLSFVQLEVHAESATGEAIKYDQAGAAPANRATGVAAQATAAAGGVFPTYASGIFNADALVWPAATDTLTERMAAFQGSPTLGVRRLI